MRILNRFDEIKRRWQIPTQNCVLAHVTTQMEAIRRGAPADLIFQSIAGSQKGNEAFGFDAATIEEARQLMLSQGTSVGLMCSTSRLVKALNCPVKRTTAPIR